MTRSSTPPAAEPAPRRATPSRPLLAAALALAVLPVAGIGLFQYWPGYVPPPRQCQVVVGDYLCSRPALIDDAGRVWVAFETVRELFDPDISLDPDSGRVLIPTQGHQPPGAVPEPVISFLEAGPVQLSARTVTDSTGAVYVPLDIFARLHRLTYQFFPGSNTVVVDRPQFRPTVGTVRYDETYVRQTPSLLSLKLSRLDKGETVLILAEEKGRYRVRDPAGRLGWVPAEDIDVTPGGPAEPPSLPGADTGPEPPPLGGRKISLVWEAVTGDNPDPATIPDMPSLNVVSPTWLSLSDTEGTLNNLGDTTYVRWAHEKGYRVWGLVTNSFSPALTHAVLPNPSARDLIVRQLLWYAALYDLDGINLDFENMYLSEKDDYVALARRLVPLAHALGLEVSVDVTFISSSELWSRCFDRPALADACDYVIVMGYDEHTSASNPGPVGSLPWVEAGLQRLLKEQQIPPSKLVLGVPFYTRLYRTAPGQRGQVVVYSMDGVRNLLADKGLAPVWDPAAGQYYVDFTEDGLRCRLWIEDATSMAARVQLVAKYGLAGLAAWRRGFENQDIWPVIASALNQD